MRVITPEQVLAGYQASLWQKTAPTRIKKLLTLADVEAESEHSFVDLEAHTHEITIGRAICVGVEGERWTTSIASLERERYPISDEDAQGYREYKMKNPHDVLCFDIPFPFILQTTRKMWECTNPTGAIITWNGKHADNLDMRVIKRSIFEKTYKRLLVNVDDEEKY